MFRLVFAVFAVWSAAACAHAPEAPSGTNEGESLEPGIYAVASGEKLTDTQLYDRLAEHRFVVVGESHGTQWHHDLEADVLRALHERRQRVALGMEMFQRPFQEALDAYVAGEIDEATMLEQTEYADRWGVEPAYYRPLWGYARTHAFPIVALNARAGLTKKIARVGLEGLSNSERRSLPETIDTSNEAHRAIVRRAFGAHGDQMSEAQFEHFYQAQVTWDETMAHRAVRFLESHPDVEAMCLVVGTFHAHSGFAVPARIERRLARREGEPSASKGVDGDVASIMPLSAEEGESLWKASTLDALREREVADFVWVE